ASGRPGAILAAFACGWLASAPNHAMGFDQRLHEVEHTLRMAPRRYIEKRTRYPPVAVEDEGCAIGQLAVEHTEGPRQLAPLVRQQREGEAMLIGEGAMRRG